MEKQLKYKDVQKEMPIKKILENFKIKNSELEELLGAINQSANNKKRKFIDYRILSALISEIERIKIYELKNDTLALSTRNVFELNMIYRYTCLSDDNLKEWIGNKAKDEIEILEGILKLSENSNSDEERIIKERIDKINTTAQQQNLKVKKQLNTKSLAEKVGLVAEYNGLFKLYSKFIHPTSYLINSAPVDIESLQYKNIFLIQFQTYLYDLESRLRDFYISKHKS
ncbi:MAG: hypothetical protein ACI85I_000427 [Arenicella sp.]|jgi:hypothetical protein